MSDEIEIVLADHSDRVVLGRSRPQVDFRTDGSSYINKKAASLLNIKHGDLLAVYHSPDFKVMWLVNSDDRGANVSKTGGLYKFSAAPTVRKMFEAFGITGKKAKFRLADKLDSVPKFEHLKGLYIVPKPFNHE